MAKKPGVKPPTKSEIMNNMAESTGLSKKEIAAVMEALTQEIENNISKNRARRSRPWCCRPRRTRSGSPPRRVWWP